MCVWVTGGGQGAWVVHRASDQAWGGGRLPIVAYTVEDSGVTLGYRDAGSLQELRLLLACVPAQTTTSLLLLTQLLEVRLDDSRVELEANAAIVANGDRDELQRWIHRRDRPIVLAVLTCLCRLWTWRTRVISTQCT